MDGDVLRREEEDDQCSPGADSCPRSSCPTERNSGLTHACSRRANSRAQVSAALGSIELMYAVRCCSRNSPNLYTCGSSRLSLTRQIADYVPCGASRRLDRGDCEAPRKRFTAKRSCSKGLSYCHNLGCLASIHL